MGDTRYSTEPDDPVAFTRQHDRYYTALGSLYDAAVRRLPIWNTWLAHTLPYIEGPRVLEVSFGTGSLLTQFAATADAHGVDYNRKMVEIARRNISRSGVHAALLQANVEHLPYRTGFFDSIVNTMAFSGYPDGQKALAEMLRVLRPGGRLILLDVDYPADGNALGTGLAHFWKASGDLLRDMGALFRTLELDATTEEIGGFGSIHLHVATTPNSPTQALPTQ